MFRLPEWWRGMAETRTQLAKQDLDADRDTEASGHHDAADEYHRVADALISSKNGQEPREDAMSGFNKWLGKRAVLVIKLAPALPVAAQPSEEGFR